MNDKIIKLLNLTNSENDHEALSALRAAQNLMNRDGHTFDKFSRDAKANVDPLSDRSMDKNSPWATELEWRTPKKIQIDQEIAYVLLNIGARRLHMALELRQQIHDKGYLKPTYETKLSRLLDMARQNKFEREFQED